MTDKIIYQNPFKIPLSNKSSKKEEEFLKEDVAPKPEKPINTIEKETKLTVERRRKDIHFEGYEDLHYIIKNIAGRLSTTSAQKITFAQLSCDLLESELKRRFKGEYKEFSELYKKLNKIK